MIGRAVVVLVLLLIAAGLWAACRPTPPVAPVTLGEPTTGEDGSAPKYPSCPSIGYGPEGPLACILAPGHDDLHTDGTYCW